MGCSLMVALLQSTCTYRCSRESGIPGNLASLHTFCCFRLGLGLGSGFSLIDMHGGGAKFPGMQDSL